VSESGGKFYPDSSLQEVLSEEQLRKFGAWFAGKTGIIDDQYGPCVRAWNVEA
jgi:hypothetical protein